QLYSVLQLSSISPETNYVNSVQLMDHCVLMNEDGIPLMFDEHTSLNLDSFVVPDNCTLFLIKVVALTAQQAQTKEGIQSLETRILKTYGHPVVEIDAFAWQELLDSEKIPYVLQKLVGNILLQLASYLVFGHYNILKVSPTRIAFKKKDMTLTPNQENPHNTLGEFFNTLLFSVAGTYVCTYCSNELFVSTSKISSSKNSLDFSAMVRIGALYRMPDVSTKNIYNVVCGNCMTSIGSEMQGITSGGKSVGSLFRVNRQQLRFVQAKKK
ncbi:unnamed protein product, partial [Allacma fusca]